MGIEAPLQPKDPSTYVGNLTDFVVGVDKDHPLNLDITIDDKIHKIVVFHDRPFCVQINHYEYDIDKAELYFVFQNGEKRYFGHPFTPTFCKYMQNTHQILTVEMDPATGQSKRGEYIPVLLQQY